MTFFLKSCYWDCLFKWHFWKEFWCDVHVRPSHTWMESHYWTECYMLWIMKYHFLMSWWRMGFCSVIIQGTCLLRKDLYFRSLAYTDGIVLLSWFFGLNSTFWDHFLCCFLYWPLSILNITCASFLTSFRRYPKWNKLHGVVQLFVMFLYFSFMSSLLSLVDLQVYSIRDAAANNVKRLAEEFGPTWAMEHIIPQVLLLPLISWLIVGSAII